MAEEDTQQAAPATPPAPETPEASDSVEPSPVDKSQTEERDIEIK